MVVIALRHLIEGIKEQKMSDIIIFINFNKIFNAILKGQTIAYDILDRPVITVEGMFSNIRA